MSLNDIIFIGDIHRRWEHIERGLQALPAPPRHVVLLGDIEAHAPLDTLTAGLRATGATLHWIFGNHDYDGGPEMWANLTDPALNPQTSAGALHGRVVEIGGLRVAGLGGTFAPRVWHPPHPPRLHSREQLPADRASLGPGWSDFAIARLEHTLSGLAIWPEDVEALAQQRADVLVTHEAPSCHPRGVAVLDDLARRMGAKLVVHGHHHLGYRAVHEDGLEVQGVGAAWGLCQHGRVHWPGEEERWLGRPQKGWEYRLTTPPA